MSDTEAASGASDEADTFDRRRRRVLWTLPTGLFVVGSRSGDRLNLMTCNWVMQVAIEPKLVAVSVERESVTRGLIEEGGGFAVSVLARSDRSVVRRFVKPVQEIERDGAGRVVAVQGIPVHEVAGGLPCLASSVAWLACTVRSISRWDAPSGPGGASHVLFVGEVVAVGEAEPREILRMEDTRMNYGG
jgi:flavin reductase (DIM6/NTAB) family NADH-FMN oxidoreductase RutF